jgi:hypothetical protein
MSKRKILKHHNKFEKNINNILTYGLKIINDGLFHGTKKMLKEEKSILLEALLLRSCALWESFVENEVVLLVELDQSKLNVDVGLSQSTKLNLKLIRALLFSDMFKNYYNIEQSKGYFKKILLNQYNLFNEITSEQRRKTNFVYKMRNYLSHYSVFSKKRLFAGYKKIYGYKNFQEPGIFLMKEKGKYFENLLHNFVIVSITMKKKLN